MRIRRNTVLVGVLTAGVLLTQQACAATTDQQSAAPAVSTKPAASSASSPSPSADSTPGEEEDAGSGGSGTLSGPIFAGERQVVIVPVPGFESIVAVDGTGRLDVTDGEAEHGMFVLTPHNGKFLIKTAKADAGGEPSCLGVKNNGTHSLTVVAAACDAGRDGQLFDITEQDKKDQDGDPTYAISNRSAFLQVFPDGLIAEELGDAPLLTTYSFADNGPSELPVLD